MTFLETPRSRTVVAAAALAAVAIFCLLFALQVVQARAAKRSILAEQDRIVAKVDALMALCDQLEASLAATAATRRRLTDALLAEALAPIDDRELKAAE